MEKKLDISDELKTLSPLLAGIDKVNVFSVPQGYFDSISATVIACLSEDQQLFSGIRQHPDNVPKGYFDSLASSILDKIKIKDSALDEIRNLSPLLSGIQANNVFQVPEGYFDIAGEKIFSKINGTDSRQETEALSPLLSDIRGSNPFEVPAEYFDKLDQQIFAKLNAVDSRQETAILSPLLSGIRGSNPFEVPAEYFDKLDQQVISKINNVDSRQEIAALSPLLFGIQGSNPFEAPAGYFDKLPANILSQVTPSPASKVVSMRGRSFIKYAAAAMIAIVIGLGFYKYTSKPVKGITVAATTTAVPAVLDAAVVKGKSMNDDEFNEALDNLKEADIAKYLENNGDATDVADLNNSIENINLPSQDDYILDETTLDNYLKEIEKTSNN